MIKMAAEHLKQVAEMQIKMDPEYFLSCFGQSFIENIILKSFILYDGAFAYLYIVDKKIAGYVSGVDFSSKFYLLIIRKNIFLIPFYVIKGLLKKPRLIIDIFNLLRFLFVKHPRSDIKAEMFSWWVLPEYRIGSEFYKKNKIKIGRELWSQANNLFNSLGVKRYRLITPTDNYQSNRFYTNMDYEFVGTLKLFNEEKNFYIGDIDKSGVILRGGSKK